MKHPSHEHPLILNEDYIAKEGDVCRGCNEQMISCKSFVYSCSDIPYSTAAPTTGILSFITVSCDKFLLHKSCAELPPHIQNSTNPKDFLSLRSEYFADEICQYLVRSLPPYRCSICGIPFLWNVKQFFYYSFDTYVRICIKCAMFQVESSQDTKLFKHEAHSQHSLALIQRPSSFKCDACTMEYNVRDVSYKCTECPFWMHKSCADAPASLLLEFHKKHPLTLSYFLPQVYHKFIQYCSLCNKTFSRLDWIYYCPGCRLLVHFRCARSSRVLSWSASETDDSDVVHLPAADESSVDILREQFIKAVGGVNRTNTSISKTDCVGHWDHKEHHLQLITITELSDRRGDDNEIVLLCDCCIKPIRADNGEFYACVPCKYFLHKACAEFPLMIEHHLGGGKTLSIRNWREVFGLFDCDACGFSLNGIFLAGFFEQVVILHIGCATIPRTLKHEAHRHQLTQVFTTNHACKACGGVFGIRYKHGCEGCDFYICAGCIMKARTAKHPWDPHPLRLIYEPGMVMDHEHDFNCEFCSQDIDPSFWFYHCDACDLSFHLKDCFERSQYGNNSNVKFGATGIYIHRLHPHSLTYVLNKKVRRCKTCHKNQLGEPVLECSTSCKAVFCRLCCLQSN